MQTPLARGVAAFFLQNRGMPDIRCGRFQLVAERAAWFAAIAQLVEHVIRNDGVTGSNPVCGTSYFVKIIGYIVRGLLT